MTTEHPAATVKLHGNDSSTLLWSRCRIRQQPIRYALRWWIIAGETLHEDLSRTFQLVGTKRPENLGWPSVTDDRVLAVTQRVDELELEVDRLRSLVGQREIA